MSSVRGESFNDSPGPKNMLTRPDLSMGDPVQGDSRRGVKHRRPRRQRHQKQRVPVVQQPDGFVCNRPHCPVTHHEIIKGRVLGAPCTSRKCDNRNSHWHSNDFRAAVDCLDTVPDDDVDLALLDRLNKLTLDLPDLATLRELNAMMGLHNGGVDTPPLVEPDTPIPVLIEAPPVLAQPELVADVKPIPPLYAPLDRLIKYIDDIDDNFHDDMDIRHILYLVPVVSLFLCLRFCGWMDPDSEDSNEIRELDRLVSGFLVNLCMFIMYHDVIFLVIRFTICRVLGLIRCLCILAAWIFPILGSVTFKAWRGLCVAEKYCRSFVFPGVGPRDGTAIFDLDKFYELGFCGVPHCPGEDGGGCVCKADSGVLVELSVDENNSVPRCCTRRRYKRTMTGGSFFAPLQDHYIDVGMGDYYTCEQIDKAIFAHLCSVRGAVIKATILDKDGKVLQSYVSKVNQAIYDYSHNHPNVKDHLCWNTSIAFIQFATRRARLLRRQLGISSRPDFRTWHLFAGCQDLLICLLLIVVVLLSALLSTRQHH